MTTDPTIPTEATPRIDPVFRGGSMTAVCIILGFSLGFTAQWATDESPWNRWDYVAAFALAVGILLQIRALADLLGVNSLELPVYIRAKNRFLAGLLVTALSITLVIIVNAVPA
ncbi:hypothetical protein OSH10_13240 [Kaistia defluvii]|uniref:hypothetical protein n=1 Tax=Kaistia defluvii TaxID=410841 RepID=UPI00225B91C5|nr:hypothetical protein [Kaistia defluvii]MCX5519399.1 hypothetical protein [Kaistia defluvii]